MPYFVLQENYSLQEQEDHKIPIFIEAIEGMYQRGVFKLIEPLCVNSASQDSVTRISLRLQVEPYDRAVESCGRQQEDDDSLLSISGFPRVLCTQDSIIPASHSDVEDNAASRVAPLHAPLLPHAHTEPDSRRLVGKLSTRLSRPKNLGQSSRLDRQNDLQLPFMARSFSDTSSLVALAGGVALSMGFAGSQEEGQRLGPA